MSEARLLKHHKRVVSILTSNLSSDINCRECGSHFSPCIASGQSILAKEYYTCKTCKHKALEAELKLLPVKHCTLCHGILEPNMAGEVG